MTAEEGCERAVVAITSTDSPHYLCARSGMRTSATCSFIVCGAIGREAWSALPSADVATHGV